MKRYVTAFLIMSLALVVSGLAASTEGTAPTQALALGGATASAGEWTPDVEAHVAQWVAGGVPSSGECLLAV